MMNSPWKLRDAKARFSELVECALAGDPQHVTRRGAPAVVVISEKEYQKSKNRVSVKKKKSLLEVMQSCPAPEIFDLIEDSR
jgi:antitoxin Phd